MAKTEYMITLDYFRAIRYADSLDKISERIRSHGQTLLENGGSIQSEWKGDNASLYLQKVDVVADNLNTISKNIQNTADTVRRVAKRTYDTEMASLEIARNSTYK